MIERRRHPDGSNHDVDRGPGPVGRMPATVIHAVPLTEAMGMPALGMYPQTAAKRDYKRQWKARQRA